MMCLLFDFDSSQCCLEIAEYNLKNQMEINVWLDILSS